ncbi:MAG: glyoxylate/hydroxypyruvate reductase A, partial [Planktomarina sp.]
MINVLFAAGDGQFETYAPHLQHSFANRDLDVDLRTDFPPSQVDYIVYAPSSALQDFTPYIRCKGVLSLWAGVERIVGNHTLTQPLCRMVDVG